MVLDIGPFCHCDSPEYPSAEARDARGRGEEGWGDAVGLYELYGLVEHHGSLSSGHYVAYATSGATGLGVGGWGLLPKPLAVMEGGRWGLGVGVRGL